ncbi:hypothetical protein VUN82_14580 [Micrococcaceae bacterium Sec5.1]
MQLRTILRSLWRRWYLVLFGIALTLLVCIQVQQNTPEKYKAQASLVMMPSAQTVGADGNPYLKLGGMGEALDILTRRLSADEVRRPLAERFATSTYTAETDRGTSGAILLITAVSSSPQETMETLQAVMDQAPVSLKEMQEALDVPLESRISTMTLVVDRGPVPEVKARTQLLLVAGAGGAGLTLVLTALADGLLTSRGHNGQSGRKGTRKSHRGHLPATAQRSPAHEQKERRSVAGSLSSPTLDATSGFPGGITRSRAITKEHDLMQREVPTPVPLSQRPS